MSKIKPKDGALNKDLVQPAGKSPNPNSSRAFREFIESVVIAVILAFLFRAFEAEAFVIPTGSMAPTLQGRHMDVFCPECGYEFRVGASSENTDSEEQGKVISGICPICRHKMEFDSNEPNQNSFTGDRILVSKFSYDLFEPERWDVIVFKYPGNAKQNYIKRLVGLPGETLQIYRGDIFVKGEGENEFHIARKAPEKLKAMLQLVDDTDHWSPTLVKAGWPSRWQPEGSGSPQGWQSKMAQDGANAAQTFSVDGPAEADAWLRYRHLVPSQNDWEQLRTGDAPVDLAQRRGALIRDFYAYNTSEVDPYGPYGSIWRGSAHETGSNWVGDIALECNLNVKSSEGEVLLDLVEAGIHYTCRIDVKTGVATVQIDRGAGKFTSDDGAAEATEVQSAEPTSLQGAGAHELRFSNADNQLTLWVDDKPIAFNGPTSFLTDPEARPHWNSADPGDLAPAGIGVRGAAVEASQLRIYRDVYYLALKRGGENNLDYVANITEGGIL